MTDLCWNLEHAVWSTGILNSLKENIFARLKKIAINQPKTMQSLDLWKIFCIKIALIEWLS